MHLSPTKAIVIIAAIAALVAVAVCWPAETAHSEHVAQQVAVEPTQADYERLCGLVDVVCPNEAVATVTGYTSRPEETDDTPCIAAFGNDICAMKAKGQNVCASNDYPKGTVLHVDGLGTCTVLDRMNRRYTGTGNVDWYFGADLAAARAWGRVKGVHISVE